MKRTAKRSVKNTRMRLKQLEAENLPVKQDWKYWSLHALHWCALLACIISFIYINYVG